MNRGEGKPRGGLSQTLVSSLRSANNLTATLPARATTPVPSADADSADDHFVRSTCESGCPGGPALSHAKPGFPYVPSTFARPGTVSGNDREGPGLRWTDGR